MIKKQLLGDLLVWGLIAALYLHLDSFVSSVAAFTLGFLTVIYGLTAIGVSNAPLYKLEPFRKSKGHLRYVLTTEVVEGALIFAAGHHVLGVCYTLFTLLYTLRIQNRLGAL